VKIITTDPISLTEDREHSKLTNQIPAVLAPPTSMKLLQEISLGNSCSTACRYKNQTYVGLDGGSVVKIGPDYKVTQFIKLSNHVAGMAVCGDQLLTTTSGDPQTVSIHELSTGRLVTSWAHSDNVSELIDWTSSILAVVGDQIIISDRGNKRLSVYSKVGRLIKHIPCPQLSPNWVSLSAADNDSIILSDYHTSKVRKISITTGDVIWTSSDVTQPLEVTCYNNQYVLVASVGETTKISILDISTGELRNII
jgi:outer membrane protein assembly factor BamB